MQRLDADAALFFAVEQILKGDSELATRLPGSFHFGRLPLGTPLPALAWIIKGGPKDKHFGVVASQMFTIWFKVNTQSSDAAPFLFAGSAANARLRALFDGPREALETHLRPRGWHLQGLFEEQPITPSEEPIGSDMTSFAVVQGGIYRAQLQPLPQ